MSAKASSDKGKSFGPHDHCTLVGALQHQANTFVTMLLASFHYYTPAIFAVNKYIHTYIHTYECVYSIYKF